MVQIFQRPEDGKPSLAAGLTAKREIHSLGVNYAKHPSDQILSANLKMTPAEGTTMVMEVAAGPHSL